jgi:hypothetical protein
MGEWSQDGDVENSARKTLPERPQRSHWKFNTKYTSIHRCQQQRNTKTTTGNISDAVNILDASNSKEATAGTPVKAV